MVSGVRLLKKIRFFNLRKVSKFSSSRLSAGSNFRSQVNYTREDCSRNVVDDKIQLLLSEATVLGEPPIAAAR